MNFHFRLLIVIIASLCLTACGGGGGGGSAPPPQPTVTVSGNNGTYWQDDTISITFSVRNMDSSTVSYAVTGSLGNNNFVVDSSAGTFRTVDDDWTESGSYSLTVTATDGGGKTASRAFQFTVDTVMTGRYEICDPTQGCINDGGRSVFLNATRDGNIWIRAWTYSGPDFDNLDALTAHLLTCTGGLNVTGADINGTASCEGQFPATPWPNGGHTDYRAVSRIEITTDLIEGLDGALSFYDAAGALLETWDGSSGEYIERDYTWPANSDLQGRYAVLSSDYQYYHSTPSQVWRYYYDNIRQSLGPFASHELWDGLAFYDGTPTFEVDSSYSLVAGLPVGDSDSSCSISGQFNQISLNEYASTNSIPNNPWRYGARVMTASYMASGCDSFVTTGGIWTSFLTGIDTTPPITFNQSSGQVVVDAYTVNGEDIVLAIAGGGDAAPFFFSAGKVCKSDGTPTIFNQQGQIDCTTGAGKPARSTSSVVDPSTKIPLPFQLAPPKSISAPRPSDPHHR